ncbi:MAG: YitT family protein [Treponemataceae bacterium]|jgi:uncharacterized membrane-anchored protein YitT (DUF2179 family)|nr:YitT family protein [Treponemataceae bacterium]
MNIKNKKFFKQTSIHTIFEIHPKTKFLPVIRILLVSIGAFLFALNLNIFVANSGLIPGGFTGISELLQRIFSTYFNLNIPFSPIYFLCNLIPAIISFKYIGKKFTLYSCLMILLSGFFTDILPVINVTDDILLSAIFGGLLSSVAVSFCLFAGATSGGTDFIAIFIAERFGKDAWNYILYGNLIILAIAGFLFGWEAALYSMIFQFTATQVLNYLYRRYQKVTLFVITNKPDEIYSLIKEITNHDATLFHGEGCFEKQPRHLIYSVISGDEKNYLINEIKHKDPDSFVNIVSSKQILGKFYRKPND